MKTARENRFDCFHLMRDLLFVGKQKLIKIPEELKAVPKVEF